MIEVTRSTRCHETWEAQNSGYTGGSSYFTHQMCNTKEEAIAACERHKESFKGVDIKYRAVFIETRKEIYDLT